MIKIPEFYWIFNDFHGIYQLSFLPSLVFKRRKLLKYCVWVTLNQIYGSQYQRTVDEFIIKSKADTPYNVQL